MPERLGAILDYPCGWLSGRGSCLLEAAEGLTNTDITLQIGVSRPTVTGWRQRYCDSGIVGLGRSVGRARSTTARS